MFAELGERVTSTATADFNRDGLPDLAVATGNKIWIIKGAESNDFEGGFLSRPRVAVRLNTGVGVLAVGDIDGNGTPDLLAAQISQPVEGRGWLRGLRTGGINRDILFTPTWFTRFDGRASSITTGNLDGDGRVDVVLTTDPVRVAGPDFFRLPQFPTQRGFTRWFDVGAGGFRARELSQGESDESPNAAPIIVDLNNDGRGELVSVMHQLIPISRSVTGRSVSNRSTVIVRSFVNGRLRVVDQVSTNVMLTSIAEADLRGSGDRVLVFSWYTGYGPSGSALQTGVGTIEIVPPSRGASAPRLGTLEIIDLRRPNDGDLRDEYPSAQRVLGVRDLNGDGRADIAIISVFSYINDLGQPPLVMFTQVVQSADGSMTPADTHLFRVSPAANGYGVAPRHTQAFLLFDIRQVGRPELIAFQSAIRGGPDFRAGAQVMTLHFNTNAWKPPLITDAFFSFSDGSGMSPPSASVFVLRPESPRFATIASLEVYIDQNGNGIIDTGETNIATGPVQEFGNFDFPYDLARIYGIDLQSLAFQSGTRLLAVAVDSTGARSDPYAFRVST